jgi:hypothetical protein
LARTACGRRPMDPATHEVRAWSSAAVGPAEVAQYERWADLLKDAAVSDHIEDLVLTTGSSEFSVGESVPAPLVSLRLR